MQLGNEVELVDTVYSTLPAANHLREAIRSGDEEIFSAYEDSVQTTAERHLAVCPGGYWGYPSQASAIVDADQVVKVGRWDPAMEELEITGRKASNDWIR